MISRSKSFTARRRAASGRNHARRICRAAARARRAQPARGPQPRAAAAPPRRRRLERTIRSIAVRGNQRLEPETIRAYANLTPGQTYTAATLDQALKDLYATAAVRRRHDQRRRHRRSGHRRSRKSGHQPHHPRGQQAPQGRQDPARDQARAPPDLHPLGGSRRRRPDPRAVPPPGPLRRAGRAEDRPARPEPRRRRVRDLRRRPGQGPRHQHPRQHDHSPTRGCARKCTPRAGRRRPRLPEVERYL